MSFPIIPNELLPLKKHQVLQNTEHTDCTTLIGREFSVLL